MAGYSHNDVGRHSKKSSFEDNKSSLPRFSRDARAARTNNPEGSSFLQDDYSYQEPPMDYSYRENIHQDEAFYPPKDEQYAHFDDSYENMSPVDSTSYMTDSEKFSRVLEPREAQGDVGYFKHDGKHHTNQEQNSIKKYLLIGGIGAFVLILCIVGALVLVNHFSAGNKVEPGITVSVEVPDGASTKSISDILKKAGVIDSADSFTSFVAKQDLANSLQPGSYSMVTGMDYSNVLDILLAGPSFDGFVLTIPEGFTMAQIAARVEETCGIPQGNFLAIAQSEAASFATEFPFLADAYNGSLEGFLFPKTYQIPRGSTAEDVIHAMLSQYSIEIAAVDMSTMASQGYSSYEILIIASMIERETSVAEERPLVASVIYNRLDERMSLGIDATVIYALGGDTNLSSEDLSIDSPYNTRKYKGLPPGPICSPSLDSLLAAANPAQTAYYYYVATSAGQDSHTFCETEQEFWDAKAKYEASL